MEYRVQGYFNERCGFSFVHRGLGFFSQKKPRDNVHCAFQEDPAECSAFVDMSEKQTFETDTHFRIITCTQRTILVSFNSVIRCKSPTWYRSRKGEEQHKTRAKSYFT